MKNKKLLKVVAAMTLGTLSVTCLGVGLTACAHGNGDNGSAHHWSTTEYGKDDVNHWRECTDENCDFIYQVAPHDFTNGDCVCGQPKPSSGKPDDGSGDSGDNEDGILSISACDHTQNGSRITQLVQKLYKVGDTVNHNNISVQVSKKVNGEETTENVKADITYEDPDMTTAGEKQVKVKYGGKETTYTINVMDLSGVSKNAATVTVNASASYGVSGNVVTVKSINDAVSVFKLLGTDDNTTKTINIAAGTYHEKVEFDIPNLHIVGAAEDATKTVIEFDLLAAYICPGANKPYSTDGSATVSVRAAAMGFHAENITFQNYYNTHERYLESQKIANALVPANESRNGNTMAVACLVQADKCVFDNVRFSSYHDTLYDYNGRHVYNNCFIEGRTDYVFGYGATSLYNNCTLNTIGANDVKNGGYVCATRGFVKHVNDWQQADTVIDYGYIFKGCTFTNDSKVQNGTVSLARAWSGHMTLAFIECDMSKAYAKTAYGSATDNKNKRYGSMSQGEPNPERLYEYGNTGEGALDYAALGAGVKENLCTVLTEVQKATFLDKNVIFAAKNGQYEYSSAWNGNAGVTVPATYNFADFAQGSSTSTNGQFVDFFDGAVSVKGTYWMNGSAMRLNVGDTVKINVQGKITVDWYGGVYGTAANGKITYKDGYATLTIVEDTASTNGIYIKSITVDGTQPQPDTEYYTVTVYAEDGTTVLGTIPSLMSGDKITLAQIQELVSGKIDKVYLSATKQEFDFNTGISENTSVYVVLSTELTVIDSGSFVYSYATDGLNGNEYIELKNCADNSPYLKLVSGSSIKLNVVAGTKISITGIYTGWGQIAINGVTQDSAATVNYTAAEDGYVIITLAESATQAALQGITVTAPVQLAKENCAYAFGKDGINSSKYFELNNCQANSPYLKLVSGSSVRMLVTAGTKISVTGIYTGWGQIAINGVTQDSAATVNYTAAEDGYVIITLAEGATQAALQGISITVPIKEITANYTYSYTESKISGSEYVELAAKDNGNGIAIASGHYIKMKIAANATVTISGIYYQAGNWDSFKVNGGDALAGAASGSVTFTTGEEGGEFIITAEGTQAFFTTITVTFN